MPKIIMEPQLDFKDVLIEPQRSSLSSRSQVFIERVFRFKNGKSLECVPIVAANMDTTGTFAVCDVLSKNNMITAMNKFYDSEAYSNHNFTSFHRDMYMVSTGISDADFEKLKKKSVSSQYQYHMY